MLFQLACICAVFGIILTGVSPRLKRQSSSSTCDHYDDTDACHVRGTCKTTIKCQGQVSCSATWYNDTVGVQRKGCWYDAGIPSSRCVTQSKCTAKFYSLIKMNGTTRMSLFCCCKGDNCNREMFKEAVMFERFPRLRVGNDDLLQTPPTTKPSAIPRRFIVCDQYDHRECTKSGAKCNGTITCALTPELTHGCFVAWRNDTTYHVVSKGCWPHPNAMCLRRTKCVSENVKSKQNKTVHYCCCMRDGCNRNFTFVPAPSTTPFYSLQQPGPSSVKVDNHRQLFNALCYSLVPIAGIFVIVVTLFWIWRCHSKQRHAVPTHDPDPNPYPHAAPMGCPGHVEILELRACGRFGAVWKALLDKESVAVKIFPLQDKQSWLMERDMYSIPNLKHENILRFIAVDCKTDNLTSEFWLVTEFHEKGSLYDYLKGHTLTWAELCGITESMTRGLAYLHEDISGGWDSRATKPAIAHRDFKSKNVLLRKDTTACIADFGLAMKFDFNKAVGDTHAQVGTRRYMAPEVLEGAITFSRDSFLRIDMYACALVLWEIMSRCTIVSDVGDYQLPFEEDVGLHPSLEEMQELVVHKKLRPSFKDCWLSHEGLNALCVTIEESWDHDSEGRLSAHCVEERISQMSKTVNDAASRPSVGRPLTDVNMIELNDMSDVYITNEA